MSAPSLPHDRARAELLGAINYLAAAVILLAVFVAGLWLGRVLAP